MVLTVDSEGFPRTGWTLVLEAGQGGRQALEQLCSAYWTPLYAFARRRGSDSEAAQDDVQAFLLSFLERNSLTRVASDGGRFRAFMLTAFKNHRISSSRRETAKKRGGGLQHLSLDWLRAEKGYQAADSALDAESLYHREWAITLLARVEDKLGERYRATDRGELFEALRPALRDPDVALDYEVLGTRFGMAQGTLRVAVHRLRSRYAALLREEVLMLVEGSSDIDDELRVLLGAVG